MWFCTFLQYSVLKNTTLIFRITSLFCVSPFLLQVYFVSPRFFSFGVSSCGSAAMYLGSLDSFICYAFLFILRCLIVSSWVFIILACSPNFRCWYVGYGLGRVGFYGCKYMSQLLHLNWLGIFMTEHSCSFLHHLC
jgi:hypothetical protein